MEPHFNYSLLAWAGDYPPLYESIPRSGPLVQTLLVLLFASFIYGAIRIWRNPRLTTSIVLLIYAPTFFGCLLAVAQSFIAESKVQSALQFWYRPDRFIGHIRIFLAAGVLMTLILLVLQLWALRSASRRNRG